jgi:hypothetical protein
MPKNIESLRAPANGGVVVNSRGKKGERGGERSVSRLLKKPRSEPPSFETLALLAPQDEENIIVSVVVPAYDSISHIVVPAGAKRRAGIQGRRTWVPAFAGTTVGENEPSESLH